MPVQRNKEQSITMESMNLHRLHIFIKLMVLLLVFGTGKSFHQRKNTSWLNLPTAKIIAGNAVVKRPLSHPHPHLVSIQFKINNQFKHTCGGAIIDKWTVITAAHCFDFDLRELCSYDDEPCFRIVAGLYDLSAQDPEREQISEFTFDAIDEHENFDGFHYDNDIALIHLETPLNFSSHVKPIRLVNPDREYKKSSATIAGWGKSKLEEAHHMTEFLHEARVNIFSDEQCIHQWGDDYHSENMICASGGGDTGDKVPDDKVADACQGDSGGPLVAKDISRKRRYLVGIISWGYECGIKEYPGLYTRVETYLQWIKEKRQDMKRKRLERSSSLSASSEKEGKINKK